MCQVTHFELLPLAAFFLLLLVYLDVFSFLNRSRKELVKVNLWYNLFLAISFMVFCVFLVSYLIFHYVLSRYLPVVFLLFVVPVTYLFRPKRFDQADKRRLWYAMPILSIIFGSLLLTQWGLTSDFFPFYYPVFVVFTLMLSLAAWHVVSSIRTRRISLAVIISLLIIIIILATFIKEIVDPDVCRGISNCAFSTGIVCSDHVLQISGDGRIQSGLNLKLSNGLGEDIHINSLMFKDDAKHVDCSNNRLAETLLAGEEQLVHAVCENLEAGMEGSRIKGVLYLNYTLIRTGSFEYMKGTLITDIEP
ncbi:MAG: hypothetical protein GXP63_05955 [DPANN group archaeon]|nr:hypothetical protein [DPANN group archaeon]